MRSHTRFAHVRITLTSSIGPAFAIPAVLTKAGISKDDVDFYEINEAFASQAVMSIQHLHLPYEKVNPVGGAIALGHPLGCTGARQVATALSEAKREKKKIFVTSMCIGSGMVSLLSSFSSLFLSDHITFLSPRIERLERRVTDEQGMAAVFVNEQ